MQKLIQHQITKIINKSGVVRDYYYEEHNASYPNLDSLREDHQNLDVNQIISFRKVKEMSQQTVSPLQSKYKTPTQKRMEGKRFELQ